MIIQQEAAMHKNRQQRITNKFLLVFCVVVFLSGCTRTNSNSTATQFIPVTEQPISTIFPTKQVESSGNYNIIKPLMANPFTGTNLIYNSVYDMSPNGQWVIKDGIYKDNFLTPLTLINVNSPSQRVQFNETSNSWGIELGPWSPDSSAFIRTHYSEFGKCIFTEIITIVDETLLESTPLKSECYSFLDQLYISWSKDSQKIAFTQGGYQGYGVTIYDKDGSLLNSYRLPSAVNFAWGKEGLFVSQELVGNQAFISQISFIDVEKQTVENIYSHSKVVSVIEYNKQYNELLMFEESSHNLLILNVESKKITGQIHLQALQIFNISPSNPSRYIGFQINNVECDENSECPAPNNYNFWIFDWESYSVKYYGEIDSLLGWYTSVNGFLVANYSEIEVDYDIKIVTP